MGGLFFFALYLVREKYSIARLALFAGISLILGLMMSTGISFPNGSTSTVVGATTTQTVQYVTYTATLSGANSFPPLFGFSWLLVILGILGLLFTLIEVFRFIFTPKEKQARLV